MVINLRVKTLDSQDHEFTVEDDITVRQLKERIHEKTNVEIDLQRLIYCGRVMNDDHPLSDYNVNGKVIHLVQRPPPGTTRASSSSNTESASTERHRNTDGGRNNVPFIHVLDGTVLGAMAIPMNTNSGTTQSITHSMNPSSTLCMNRITVARHMLNCVNNIANYLENPERGLNNTDMDILAQQTMESTVFEVGISAVSDPDVPQQDVQNVVQLFQGAVSAAFQQNGLPNITVDSVNGTTQATIPLVFGASTAPAIEMNAATLSNPTVRVIGVSQNPSGTNSQSASSSSTSSNSTTSSSSSTSTNQTRSSEQNTSDSSDEASSNSQQTTSPQTLAEVVQQMRTVQTRLEPFIQQYYDILQNEPTFEENDTNARESAQRIFDRVSEALHYFSHAQHAISDLMLDLSSNTPRHLCCRPILVEQSAFVSSGFAIPSMIHHIPRRTDANGNNSANADVHVEINQNTPVGLESQIEIQPQQQSSANSTSSTTTSTNSETEGSQFRVTTATHPTTSTQTRSTARPHATTGIPVGQIRNLRPAMQLSSFDRYLPCNSHHIHEPENQQQQQRQSKQSSQQQQQQQQQQITPRANRINIQRAPQVHIQRSVPNSVRFANFLSNHLQNQLQQRSTAAVSSAPTTPIQTSAPPSASLSSNSLNDMQLNTVIPIFGSNQIQLQIRDLVNVSPTPSTLNRIRSELREYLMAKLSLSSSPSEENVALAVNHVISLLNQFFLLLPDLSIPDYDARASIENLIRRTLPFMISLIRDDESVEFGTRMLREISEFSKRFIVILLHSIGRPSAQDYLKNVVEAIFTSIFATTANDDTPRVALQWLRRHIYEEILRRFQEIRLDSIDVIEFLVIRRPPPPTPTDQRQGDLMETDADDDANNETMNAEASEPAEDVELPTITFGSESWHSNFPDPWLPIITRDISRQRRQSPQRPFSDAYLSGMSSKRRKLINNSKPTAAGPTNILPQSVRQVLQSRISHGSSGASTSSASMASTAASIDDAISTNQHINEPYGSYETAILSHVQNRIRTDSNFTPERFPNCVESADFSLQFLKNAESNDEYKCLDVDRWVIHNTMVSSSCSRRTNRRAIQLFVKLLDNHTITLHTETTANVDNLKSIIEDKSKINKRVQLLFFSSKKLESTHSLEFYGIVNYSTIELSIKLSGGSDDQPNQVVPSMSGPPSSEEGSSLQSSSPEQSDSSSSDGDFSSDNWTYQVLTFLNIATPHSDLFTPAIRNGMVETCDKLLPTVPGYNPRLWDWIRSRNPRSIRLILLNCCSTLLDLLQHRTLRDELGEDVSSAVETSLQQLQNSLRLFTPN